MSAAQQVIRDRGSDKLRLSAVAEAAGVSRQTLYRWFPSKDHLLAAITEREKSTFDVELRAALAPHKRPERRLEVALRFLVTYLDEAPDPIGVDPGFALQSLARSLAAQATSLAEILGEALDEIPVVRSKQLTRVEAAEILLRLAYSHYLVPHPDSERLLGEIRAFSGIRRRTTKRAED